MIRELKAFRDKHRYQAPMRNTDFFYSKLDGDFINSYYRLRKKMKSYHLEDEKINELIKRMTSRVWMLRKGVFELIMVTFLLILLFIYIKFIPIFMGYLAAYFVVACLLWFFLRREIWNLDLKLGYSYNDLIKALEKELESLKKEKR